MSELVVTVKIPKKFYEDHLERDCSEGTIIKETKKHYIMELTKPAYIDLKSDADFYSDCGESVDFDMQWLVSSARATHQAICRDVPNGFNASAHLPTTKGN